jgi:hypothetical protein
VLLVLIAADLLVFPLSSSVADHDNTAYAALRTEPAGRVLELPMFEPGVHYGSVYDYFQLQAPRQRPGGYSTLAPQTAVDFFFVHNRLSCGVWLPGDEETLRDLDIQNVMFHAGMYVQGQVPGPWFGWQGLLAHGFTPRARDGKVTLFARGESGSAPTDAPVPEPSRLKPHLCEGWDGRTMEERQGPLWIFGSGGLRLEVSAPARLPAALWIDGQRVDTALLDGQATLGGTLVGDRWHAVVLEVPELLATKPPRGLLLERIQLVR